MVRCGSFVLTSCQWEIFSRGKNCLIEALRNSPRAGKSGELAFHFEINKNAYVFFIFDLKCDL